MARERTDLAAPLLGSALLHGGLAAALLVSWPWLGRTVQVAPPVPVTIVARAPVANVRPAEQAPVEAEAQTDEPEPDAPPEPPPPPPPPADPKVEPKAEPPKPAPKEQPAPKPKPKAAQPKPKEPTLDLEALEKSLRPDRPKSPAKKGRPRPETAVEARTAVGEGTDMVGPFLTALAADLERRWNPNCEVEGGRDVNIEVRFRLDRSGRVIGDVEASGDRSSNNVVRVAAERAKRAVREAEPFQNLPAQLYDERLTVRFNARNACA